MLLGNVKTCWLATKSKHRFELVVEGGKWNKLDFKKYCFFSTQEYFSKANVIKFSCTYCL